MSAHTCKSITPGCYRCDLNLDEVRGYVDSLVVTRKRRVHDPDCFYVSGITSTARRRQVAPGDLACAHCLPDGVPAVFS